MKYDLKVLIFIVLCVVLAVLVGLRCSASFNTTEPASSALGASESLREPIREPLIKPLVFEAPIVVISEALGASEKPVELPRLYTDEDAIALAKMCYGEAKNVKDLETPNGVVSNKCQNAACMWTIINRYDDDPFKYFAKENTIAAVVAAPTQYHGYSPKNPVDEELLELAYDVLDRWNREKHGETDVGRVLPSDYMWFAANKSFTHNRFRNHYDSHKATYWDWSLEDTYACDNWKEKLL